MTRIDVIKIRYDAHSINIRQCVGVESVRDQCWIMLLEYVLLNPLLAFVLSFHLLFW